MSLLASLQISSNSLIAAQVGLQVVANNIANANTPGYTRQEAIYTPAPTQVIGQLSLGLGVQIDGIIQQTDRFINERVRGAISDVEGTEAQKKTFLQLESIIGELTNTDLSTSLNRFFSSIHDILNQPEDLAVRNLTSLQGYTLAQDIQRLDRRVREIRNDVNDNVVQAADEINNRAEEIAKLNVQIVAAENGSGGNSEAGGLRDQRNLALGALAKLVGIRAVEQESGSVTVFANGDFLVFDASTRPVAATFSEDRGMSIASIDFVETRAPLAASTGQLGGLYAARDNVLGGFLDSVDDFAKKLIFEFNKVFSSGQGMSGYSDLESEFFVEHTDDPLDEAGLEFTPVNGSFQVLVRNKRTAETKTTDIRIDLNGLDDDTSLEDVAEQLEAVDGISATINADRGLTITADSDVLEFSFARDTSGVLAALGIGTFFSGSSSGDIGVHSTIRSDPGKFAASQNGIGGGTDNAVALASLAEQTMESTGGLTLTQFYERFTGDVFQASSVVQAVNDGFRTFQATLEGQQLGISGVNIDEQAIKMIQHQRVFQASARLISAVTELLETLVNL